MTVSLNDDVRRRLDAHLDAVERALVSAGSSREHRRGVVDDLEAQILDMLGGRSAVPTVADLEVVLAGLDPPAAYGDAGRGTPPAVPGAPVAAAAPQVGARSGAMAQPRYSKTAIWGLVLILVSLVPLPLILVLALFLQVRAPSPVMAVSMPTQSVHISNGNERVRVEIPGAPEAGPATSTVATGGATTTWASTMPASRSGFGSTFGWDGLCVLIPIFPLGLAGTILGWVAFGQIRGSRGMLRGKGIAIFDGLFYPGLIALFVVVGLIHDLL